MLQKNPENHERVLDFSQRIAKESYRIAKITNDLLHYSKDTRGEKQLVDMKQLVESALSLIVPKVRPSGIKVETELADDMPEMKVNPQGIQQIIINLVDNAYDALRYKDSPVEGKRLKISSYVINASEQPKFCIEVYDNGIGMPEKVIKKARDAFFSTKPSSEGTGLGLSIVNEIIGKHGGEFYIESEETEYTKITVTLPTTSMS